MLSQAYRQVLGWEYAHNCTVLIGAGVLFIAVARRAVPLPCHYGMEDGQEAQDRDLVCGTRGQVLHYVGRVQNIVYNPEVSFSVGEASFAGAGKVIERRDPLAAEIKKLMKSKYGWNSGLIVELAPG